MSSSVSAVSRQHHHQRQPQCQPHRQQPHPREHDEDEQDVDKFSRQSLVYGEKSTAQLRKLNAEIWILQPEALSIAYECAKNLLLSGIGGVRVRMPSTLSPHPLYKRLADLNPRATVYCTEITEQCNIFAEPASVCNIVCGGTLADWRTHNARCRRVEGQWFIGGRLCPATGSMQIWQDTGEQPHAVHDVDGEPRPDMLILRTEGNRHLHVDHLDATLRPGDILVVAAGVGGRCTVNAVNVATRHIEVECDDGGLVVAGSYARRLPRTTTAHGQPFVADEADEGRAAGEESVYAAASYIGAVMAQESLKSLGTFRPIVGWHESPSLFNNSTSSTVALASKTVLIVGAGALGCELLKGLAEMLQQDGWPHTGRIVVTDMDAIAVSNLTRQFLYRPGDVGQLKAPTAAAAIRTMYPNVQVEGLTHAVDDATCRTVFPAAFWREVDLVLTAVDNVDARVFVDAKCRQYRIPMIDSGTLGLKGSVQVVLPDHTETYSDSRDPAIAAVPVCVLKQYPYRIEHCVQWAQEKFAELADEDDDHTTPTTTIRARCTAWFQTEVVALIRQHPADAVDDDGDSVDGASTPFWSGTRRCPTALADDAFVPLLEETTPPQRGAAFDKDDAEHLAWVWRAANLRARVYAIPECSREQCRAVAGNIVPAVASTTSAVVGLVCLEVHKWLADAPPSEHRNSFLTLADGHCLVQSEPMPPRVTPGEERLDPLLGCPARTWNRQPTTCWARLDLAMAPGSTYGALKTRLETEHGVTVVGLTSADDDTVDYNEGSRATHPTLARPLVGDGEQLAVEAEEEATGTVVHFPVLRISTY
jgi:molybdopterin/thiamine biosynthesis adenylyltransferase